MILVNYFLAVVLHLVFWSDGALSFTEYPSNQRIFYYSTVEFVETPLSPIKGSIPLTREVAMTRNHYRFAYNELNQLTSVSFFNGNTPREPNHTANLFTLAHHMKFDYQEGMERITFFDENQLPIQVLGNCSAFIYSLDSLGFREFLFFLDSNGQRVTNSWGIYEYHWQYQKRWKRN